MKTRSKPLERNQKLSEQGARPLKETKEFGKIQESWKTYTKPLELS